MNLNLIKRWIRMLNGKSSFHVEQNEGKFFSKDCVKGYYNDLTNKVKIGNTLIDDNNIPYNISIHNKKIYFPGTIFQYGLGLYDLYLELHDEKYINQFINIADWTIKNQKENGIWECMSVLGDKIHETQSAMCQSQGISVLIRAYLYTNNEDYFLAADKAIKIMIMSNDKGGTCYINGDQYIFQEYVSKDNQSVLNGWIFFFFCLYDYYLVTKNDEIKKIIDITVNSLAKNLSRYDRKYWTSYDLVGTIASPAYHDLHIKQLNVMYDIFEKEEFKIYAEKWTKYQSKKTNKILSMIVKLKQKIFKSKYYDINTSLVK